LCIGDPVALKTALKELLIRVANLRDVTPAAIDEEQPLFGAGLGLDSIDMLEVVVHIEKGTGLKIRNTEAGRLALSSVANMADAILRHRAAPQGEPLSVPGEPLSVPGEPLSVPGEPLSVPGEPLSVPGEPLSVPGLERSE
jgi:acyl carrier protein